MLNQDWVKSRAQQTPSQKGHISQKEHMSFVPHPFSQVVRFLQLRWWIVWKLGWWGDCMYHKEARSWEEAIASWGNGPPKCAQPSSSGDGGGGIIGGWHELFKGNFDERSLKGKSGQKRYLDLVLGLVKEVEKKDEEEEEEGADLRKKYKVSLFMWEQKK